MSKNSQFRGPFENQHEKRFQAPLKSASTAPLSYSLMTVESIEMEKFSLIDMQSLGTAC